MIYLYIFSSCCLFLWCLAGIKMLLSMSFVLLGCRFLVFPLLLYFFFSLVTIYMFTLLAFSVLYLAYVRQIVNSRSSLLCSSGPDHSAFLPTFHSVLCFFTEALVVFGGKNREKYVYFISSEVASLTHFSSLVLRAQHHVLIAELCCTF